MTGAEMLSIAATTLVGQAAGAGRPEAVSRSARLALQLSAGVLVALSLAYLLAREPIVRASCVGCGVCSAVCPRGVLKLENGPTHGDRYAGSDRPVEAFKRALTEPPRQGHN